MPIDNANKEESEDWRRGCGDRRHEKSHQEGETRERIYNTFIINLDAILSNRQGNEED